MGGAAGPPAPAEAATEAAGAAEYKVETVQARPRRISWARLLKRIFETGMQQCPNCGGVELKIITAHFERPVIQNILDNWGRGLITPVVVSGYRLLNRSLLCRLTRQQISNSDKLRGCMGMQLRFASFSMLLLIAGCGHFGRNHDRPEPEQSGKKTTPDVPRFGGQISTENLMTALAAPKDGNQDPYAETTGETGSVPLSPGVSVGQGYSRIGHTTRGLALELTEVDVTKLTQNAISYRLVNINSYESLAKELKMSMSASYSGTGGSASARVSMYQSSKMTSSKAYALVSMTVHTHTEAIRNPRFNAAALARASSSDLAPFLTTYGDTFLYRVVRGAELYALLELSMTRKELQKKLDASAKGGMGGFSAKASMSESLSSLIKNNEVRITYVQSGGGTGRTPHPAALTAAQENKSTKTASGALVPAEANVATTGGPLILTLNEFMGRVRDFADEARSAEGMKNSVVLLGDAMDYNIVENKPASFSVKPKLPTAYALEDLGELRAKVADQMDLAEEVITQPEKFPPSELASATAKLAYMKHLDKYVDRLTRELVTFPRLADVGRPNIKIPKMADFISKSRATGTSCGLPTDGNVEAMLDCLFETTDGAWRLKPTQLPIRVMSSRLVTLHGNGPPYNVQRRFTLRDAAGEWFTNTPTKRVFMILQTVPQDAIPMPRWKQTGAVIDKDEVVLNFEMVVPGANYRGSDQYRVYLWMCPDLCDSSTIRMEDVPREEVQQTSAVPAIPDPNVTRMAPAKVKPKVVAPALK